MKPNVNIVVLVDVVGALSDGTLHNGNLSLIDDGQFDSAGQGTTDLCTVVAPGQVVQWSAVAVDVQTPVELRSISFLGAPGPPAPPRGGPGGGGRDQDPGRPGLVRDRPRPPRARRALRVPARTPDARGPEQRAGPRDRRAHVRVTPDPKADPWHSSKPSS